MKTHSLIAPANAGAASKLLPSPKLSLVLGQWSKTEFYVQGGFSFHSNDGHGYLLVLVRPEKSDSQ
jgi:hypothetical protein